MLVYMACANKKSFALSLSFDTDCIAGNIVKITPSSLLKLTILYICSLLYKKSRGYLIFLKKY